MNRRGFLGLFTAALVATQITKDGETVPTPTRADAPLPTAPPGVIGYRLYHVSADGKSHTLIATASAGDHAWTYLPTATGLH